MSEISWGEALKYGIKYIAYIIIWAIIGGLIIGAGVAMMISAFNIQWTSSTTTTTPITSQINFGQFIAGIIVMFIGEFVAIWGAIASYFKIMSGIIKKSVVEASQRPPP